MLYFLFEAGKQLLKTMMSYECSYKTHMFRITKNYIQATTSVSKSDQHSVLSLFFKIHPTLLH